ncbi:MAG TPA: peptide chain release factor N(5)-glutamine methyltransferase [Nitrospira sp.]|nr:peptide chain release factor N(5)-glutamine methyltransferase [Nitrospira sp.]
MTASNTIDALLTWAKQVLDRAGIENAAQESRWLVGHALGLEAHQLATQAEQSVSPEKRIQAESLVSRRAAREPLQYILGTQEFCGLEFFVGPAVLIPRPETEVLLREALTAIDLNKDSVLVDVGTGSGCLAVTLATILSRTRVLAVDRSPDALAAAKANAERQTVANRIEFIEGDLLSPLRDRGLMGQVDVIVSNPPYIAESDWTGLQPEVRDFEPRSALVSGPTGIEFHERLLRESKEYLMLGGSLVMEIGQGQRPAIQQMAEQIGGYTPVEIAKDGAGIERIVIVRRLD